MHTNQVALLLDLAQTHSYNQTAERLFTTQQNVSYSIRQLEKELQIKIFERTNNGVFFTPEGEEVLQCAIEMETSYTGLRQRLNPQIYGDAEDLSVLRLSFSSILLSDLLPDIMNDFYELYPSTQLVLQETPQDDVLSSLFQGNCDMVVWDVNQQYLEDALQGYNINALTIKSLFRNKTVAVIPKDSPLASRSTLAIDELNRMSKSVFGLQPIDYFGKDLRSYVLYSSGNPAVHQQLVLQHGTACFTTERLFHRFFPADSFQAMSFQYPTLPNYMLLLYRKNSWHPAYDALKKIINHHFQISKAK